LAHLLAIEQGPLFDQLQLDHRYYDEWGQRIAAGDWLGSGVFFVDPLYAYFLGGISWLSDHNLVLVRLIQFALGIATCWLTAMLGRRVSGSAATGNLAALLLAFFIPGIFYEGMIEKTSLAVFLFTLAFLLFTRGKGRSLVAAGVAMGLASLTRGNLLLLIPAGALVLACPRRGIPDVPWWRRIQIRRPALFLAGALAVLSLSTARNYIAGHEWAISTSNLGQNLYIGHQPRNTTGTYTMPAMVRPDPRYEESDFRAEAEQRIGRELTAEEVSRFWIWEAWEEIQRSPGRILKLTLRKIFLFWHQYELPDNGHVEVDARFSPVLRIPFCWMWTLVPLALLGAVVTWRRRDQARLLTMAALLYCGAVVAFFVLSRFRVLIVPLLAILAAEGIRWLQATAANRSWRRLALGMVLVLAVLAAILWEPPWLQQKRKSSLAIGLHNLGVLHMEAGRLQQAVASFDEAVSIDAASVVASLRSLGEIHLRQQRWALAEKYMRQVLQLKPQSRSGQAALVRLRRAKHARARRLIQQSAVHRRQRRMAEAIEGLKEAIRIGPYQENTRYLLGSLMEKHIAAPKMVAYYAGAAASDPKPQTSYYFWAVGLQRQGDTAGAVEKLRRALHIDPAHEMSQLRWGKILELQGKVEQALVHYQEATKILPDWGEAHWACARVLDKLGRGAEATNHSARAEEKSTTQRTVHWARYLLRRGRGEAALKELRRALQARPEDKEALQLMAQAGGDTGAPAGGTALLTAKARKAFITALRTQTRGGPVWLAASSRSASSMGLARSLRGAFKEASWTVRELRVVPFPIKPGVMILAAETNLPAYVGVVHKALQAAGLQPRMASGYREYYQQKKRQQPSYPGFAMATDQTYIVVVGRSSQYN